MVSKLEKKVKRLNRKELTFTQAVREISYKLNANYNTIWRYLYAVRGGVTNTQCQKRYQKTRKKAQTPFENSMIPTEPKEFENIPDEKENFAELEQSDYLKFCFNQLPEVYKRTLEMRFFRDLTLKQVAKIEKVAYQAVQQREIRAVIRLRDIWNEYR